MCAPRIGILSGFLGNLAWCFGLHGVQLRSRRDELRATFVRQQSLDDIVPDLAMATLDTKFEHIHHSEVLEVDGIAFTVLEIELCSFTASLDFLPGLPRRGRIDNDDSFLTNAPFAGV